MFRKQRDHILISRYLYRPGYEKINADQSLRLMANNPNHGFSGVCGDAKFSF